MYNNLLFSIYNYEIGWSLGLQKQFGFAEKLLQDINIKLNPIFIMNWWIPLAGAFNQKVLIQLVTSLGIINTFVSVLNWGIPEYRPIWWLRENPIYSKNFCQNLKIYPSAACDVSSGMPSYSTSTFTAFAFIVVCRFIKTFSPTFQFGFFDKHFLVYVVVTVLVSFYCSIRLFFLHEFFHQCLVAIIIAGIIINALARIAFLLLRIKKFPTFMLVVLFSLVPIILYFLMLLVDEDPLWSVRMGFKWCGDIPYLKFERSSVYMLFRDFGYLTGVALSMPLLKNYKNTCSTKCSYFARIIVLGLIELLNFYASGYLPKDYGRVIVLAYEFGRNFLHSFTLLKLLPILELKLNELIKHVMNFLPF